MGKSSVTYEIAVFERGAEDVRAVGGFIHVFVDKEKNRPAAEGMSSQTRRGLERLMVKDSARL